MDATRTCSIDGCKRPHKGRGYCAPHYSEWRRQATSAERVWPTRSERFWAKVDRANGPDACWTFTGGRNGSGYGVFHDGTRTVRAHRYAFLTETGHEADGLLDHTCHNVDRECPGGVTCPHRRCVNPRHLEVVTHAENVARGRAGQHQRRGPRATQCPSGHPYDEENTYKDARGHQYCRACARERQRKRRERSAT